MDDFATREWWVPPAVLVMGVVAGAVLGAVTNMVNAGVSAQYFAIVLRVRADHAWIWGIQQGMFEGAILGAVFGVVVGISFAASTRFYGPFHIAARAWWVAVAVALVCWLVGGVCGWLVGRASPVGFQRMFPLAPADPGKVARFAWVGGSIWGGYAGTVVASVAACVYQHVAWRRENERVERRFEVQVGGGACSGPRGNIV
jgi:hypothetical protein